MYDNVGEDKADAAVMPCVLSGESWKRGPLYYTQAR